MVLDERLGINEYRYKDNTSSHHRDLPKILIFCCLFYSQAAMDAIGITYNPETSKFISQLFREK